MIQLAIMRSTTRCTLSLVARRRRLARTKGWTTTPTVEQQQSWFSSNSGNRGDTHTLNTENAPRGAAKGQQQQHQPQHTSSSLYDEIRKALDMPTYSTASTATSTTTRHNLKVPSTSSLRDRHLQLRKTGASTSLRDSKLSVATSPSLKESTDIFDIPDLPLSLETTKSNNPHDETWEHYSKMMETIVMKDPHFRRQHTVKPISAEKADPVIAFLLSNDDDEKQQSPTTTRTLLQQALERHGGDYGTTAATTDRATSNTASHQNNDFASAIYQQKRQFMEQHNFDQVQYEMLQGALYQMTNMCAKMAQGRPAPVLWRKTLQAAITNKKMLHNLLHITATFAPLSAGMFSSNNSGSSGNSSRRRRSKNKYTTMSILDILDDHDHRNSKSSSSSGSNGIEEEEAMEAAVDLVDAVDEIAIYHDLLHDATEQTINVRIRLLVAQGRAQQAALLLHQHASANEVDDDKSNKKSNNVLLRLRSYAPVLSLFLDQSDLEGTIRLYQEMRRVPSVHLDVDTYIQIVAGIAERGGFRPDYEVAENEHDSKDNSDTTIHFGPSLLDQLVSEMSEEVIEISATAARRLYNALCDGFPSVEGLEKTKSLLAPLPVNNTPISTGSNQSVIASRVIIDPRTGTCPRTGIKLELKSLTTEQSHQLKESIMTLARESQQNRKPFPAQSASQNDENHADKAAEAAVQSLQKFHHWLDTRHGEPFTVIVDGPNIGYYMQNFEDGRFSYHQIQFVVDYLERLGERPLVILPRKYLLDFFKIYFGSTTNGGPGGAPRKQRLTSAEKRIRDELSLSGKIAAVPPGQHDDYFWILASTTKQTAATGGKDLYVPPSTTTSGAIFDDQGDNATQHHSRWPGARPVVLTNDNMRDHKLGLLEPMLFRRWHSNYIVNYTFAAFVGRECTHPDIGFHPADFFSREIQGHRLNDNEDNGCSMVWHFPIADKVGEWFCISIRSPTK